MDDAVCEVATFVRARFLGGGSGMEYGGRRVTFVGCDFTEAVFDRVEFRASTFVDCTFTGAALKRCDFRGVKFEGGILPLAHQFEFMEVPDLGLC
ncbi:pentapeptide repeat-containing protein [uncultured Pseudomonas sp.]|uniref:pentapeptide repeat-containing protein n=1 Tax=uncultured Pseudomonas sp. TaxID=114707 RepID=UPI0025DCA146|nr:pentapeptide repeat-containing protein [uncultured Pseudomonas sp.]